MLTINFWLYIYVTMRRITAVEMKYMRRTAGYIWTDYETNAQIAKELKITPILDKLLEYKRNWIQHVNRMPRNRLPRVMKRYSPTGRRNHGRPLKRLLDTWDRNGSTSGPTPWQTYDDDELQAKNGLGFRMAFTYQLPCLQTRWDELCKADVTTRDRTKHQNDMPYIITSYKG